MAFGQRARRKAGKHTRWPLRLVGRERDGVLWSPLNFGSNLTQWWNEDGISASGSELTQWACHASASAGITLATPEPASPNGPTVVTNGGQNAVRCTRADSEYIRKVSGVTGPAHASGVIWAVFKTNTINATQTLFSMGRTALSSSFFQLWMQSFTSQCYPGLTISNSSGNTASWRLATASEEATNASWRQVPTDTPCALAVECDSSGNTTRIFFANSTTMREFGFTDNNDGLLAIEALAGTGSRGDFMSYMSANRDRIGIGAAVANSDANDTNFSDATIFEVGISSALLGSNETDFLAYLQRRRALKT